MQRIDAGAFGSTYIGEDLKNNRQRVAIKFDIGKNEMKKSKKDENHLKYEFEVYKSALVRNFEKNVFDVVFSMTMDLKQSMVLHRSIGSVFNMDIIFLLWNCWVLQSHLYLRFVIENLDGRHVLKIKCEFYLAF